VPPYKITPMFLGNVLDFKDSENVLHTFEICHNSTFIQEMVD
jgi:hypothetical protein